MQYKWIGPGVLGFGTNAVKIGDVLPEKYSGRIKEFLKDKKIKLLPEESKPEPEKKPEEVKKEIPEESKPEPKAKVKMPTPIKAKKKGGKK